MPDTSTSSTNGDSKDETPNTTISAFHVKTKEVTLKNGIHISLQTDATINATSYMSDNVTSDGGIHVRGKGGEVAEFFNATGIDLEPQKTYVGNDFPSDSGSANRAGAHKLKS